MTHWYIFTFIWFALGKWICCLIQTWKKPFFVLTSLEFWDIIKMVWYLHQNIPYSTEQHIFQMDYFRFYTNRGFNNSLLYFWFNSSKTGQLHNCQNTKSMPFSPLLFPKGVCGRNYSYLLLALWGEYDWVSDILFG